MKRERDPTPEEFEKLLAWLASAGRDYQTMHYRLTRIFVAEGCSDAERLADEVLNRVAVRIDKVVSDYKGDPIRCLRGFAENVAREDRIDRNKLIDIEWVDQSVLPADPEREAEERKTRDQEDACMAKCKAELTKRERNVFSRYFQDETKAKIARRELAAELGITANALRIKAHRIGRRLRHCLEKCRDEAGER